MNEKKYLCIAVPTDWVDEIRAIASGKRWSFENRHDYLDTSHLTFSKEEGE